MKYTPYGNTGKSVSTVGFGGMRFDMERDAEENAELVRYANLQGINYFDTAPGYCQDKSEDIFGLAFADMPGDFYVSTKVMPTDVNTIDGAREAVEKSLRRLGVPKIHFFHVWCLRCMDHYHLAMQKGGLYEGLVRCRDEGLIDHIVFSSHQTGAEIRTIVERGEFEGVLLGMNILNFPFRQEGAKTAIDSGCGVVAMNPLSGGLIPRNEDRLGFLCRGDETPTEAALDFCLGSPLITVALNGFTTREHVDAACARADQAKPFPEKELVRLTGLLGENMDAVCTTCGYCKGCPKAIPIPRYMQFYNQKVLFDKDDESMRKSLDGAKQWGILVGIENTADECIECGLCEEKCTQHLPIIERLKTIAKWEQG